MTAIKRTVKEIALDIRLSWKTPYFGAVPYIDAMLQIESVHDDYHADSAREVCLYFLSNATSWRGPDARRIKAELKGLLGLK